MKFVIGCVYDYRKPCHGLSCHMCVISFVINNNVENKDKVNSSKCHGTGSHCTLREVSFNFNNVIILSQKIW